MAPLRLVALVVALVARPAAASCAEFEAMGYCSNAGKQAYMAKHCPSQCGGSGGAADEDTACAKWAAEGYCEHEQFSAYMDRSCPRACNRPADYASSGAADLLRDEMHYAEGEEEEEGEDEDDGEAAEDEAGAAPEPADCAGWARQGLCETGEHLAYMKASCPQACATAKLGEADAGSAGATTYSASECGGWAGRGLCADGGEHASFMNTYCAEQCEAERNRDPLDGVPPTAGLGTFLLVGGFLYVAVKGMTIARASDGARSVTVSRGLGATHADTLGPGKLNRAALHRGEGKNADREKRSAKKASQKVKAQ